MPLHNPVGSGGEEKPQELLRTGTSLAWIFYPAQPTFVKPSNQVQNLERIRLFPRLPARQRADDADRGDILVAREQHASAGCLALSSGISGQLGRLHLTTVAGPQQGARTSPFHRHVMKGRPGDPKRRTSNDRGSIIPILPWMIDTPAKLHATEHGSCFGSCPEVDRYIYMTMRDCDPPITVNRKTGLGKSTQILG